MAKIKCIFMQPKSDSSVYEEKSFLDVVPDVGDRIMFGGGTKIIKLEPTIIIKPTKIIKLEPTYC